MPLSDRQPQDAKNRIERRAILLADAVEDHAKRLAAAMDEPAVDSLPVSADMQRQMWDFSPFGPRAALVFWQMHDQMLAQSGDHGQAEAEALRKVYPYREQLVGIGATTLEQQVQRANRIARLVAGREGAPHG